MGDCHEPRRLNLSPDIRRVGEAYLAGQRKLAAPELFNRRCIGCRQRGLMAKRGVIVGHAVPDGSVFCHGSYRRPMSRWRGALPSAAFPMLVVVAAMLAAGTAGYAVGHFLLKAF